MVHCLRKDPQRGQGLLGKWAMHTQRRKQERPYGEVKTDTPAKARPEHGLRGRNEASDTGVSCMGPRYGTGGSLPRPDRTCRPSPEAGLQSRQNEMHRKVQSFGGHGQGRGGLSVTQPPSRQPSPPPVGRPRAPRARGPTDPGARPEAHLPASEGPLLSGPHRLQGRGATS